MRPYTYLWYIDFPVLNSFFHFFQEMASLKRQFTELLSDIGFVKEGLRAREIEKRAQGGDGILDATGEEVKNVQLVLNPL